MADSGKGKLSGVCTLAVISQPSPKGAKLVSSVEMSAFHFLVAAFLAAMSAVNVTDVKPLVENSYWKAMSVER